MEVNYFGNKKNLNDKTEIIYKLFVYFIKTYSGENYGPSGLYSKQKKFVKLILCKLLLGHKGNRIDNINYIKSRQSGGSQILMDMIAFLMIFAPFFFEQETFKIILTANKKEQVADFFLGLTKIIEKFEQQKISFSKKDTIKVIKITEKQKNASIILSNGGQVRIISLQSANNVGKTSDIIFMDEVQDIELVNFEQIKRSLRPMLNKTNGNVVHIGVGNDHSTAFKKLIDQNKSNTIFYDVYELREELIALSKKYTYNFYKTNLIKIETLIDDYEDGLMDYMDKRVFETEFLLKWLMFGPNSFISENILIYGKKRYNRIEAKDIKGTLKLGIDYGKKGDKTVGTLVEQLENGRYRIVDWYFSGKKVKNYNIQLKEMLNKFLPYFETGLLNQITTDNTGVGESVNEQLVVIYDEFKLLNSLKNISMIFVSFTEKLKHYLGLNLLKIFTQKKLIYGSENENTKQFEKEMLELEKMTIGLLFKYKHKSDSGNDDYPDSLALALLSFVEKKGKDKNTGLQNGYYGNVNFGQL